MHRTKVYSLKCVEGEFCEVRSARSRSGIYSGLAPSAVQRTMPTMSSIARPIARSALEIRSMAFCTVLSPTPAQRSPNGLNRNLNFL